MELKYKENFHLNNGNSAIRVYTLDSQKRNQTVVKRMIPLVLVAFVVGFLFQLLAYDSIPIFGFSISSKEFLERRTSKLFSNRKNARYDDDNELVVRMPHINEKEEKLWLQPKLFDLNFSWIQNNETICLRTEDDPDDVRLMPVLVHTARSHFAERLDIRRTWGSLPIYKKWDLRFVFLLGEANKQDDNPENETLLEKENRKLAEEQAKFGDVVIGSFTDTYHNLTYKHMMGYKWVLNFCHNATIVLKVDDDVFIDIIKWLDWLTADLTAVETGTAASLSVPDIYCKLWAHSEPFREETSKWYVSYDDFPETFYPPFCSGWAYSIPVDLMEKIYSVSNSIKFNWIDDVFVTGQLVQLVKNNYKYPLKIEDLSREITMDPEQYKAMCHDQMQAEEKRTFKVIAKVERGEFFERDMMCMWNKTLADNSEMGNRIFS